MQIVSKKFVRQHPNLGCWINWLPFFIVWGIVAWFGLRFLAGMMF